MARRALPLMLLGATATVILRRRLAPRPALPPGSPAAAADADLTVLSAEQLGMPPEALAAAGEEPLSEDRQGRFMRQLRRAPIDIVTVVDDLLGSAR
jgi:hypothetical protein